MSDDTELYLIYKAGHVVASNRDFKSAVAEAKRLGAEYIEHKGGEHDGEVAWMKR